MASMLKSIIYILHFFFHEDTLIDWGLLISNEISFQLGGLKRTQKFYKTYYLNFFIAYCHVFEDLSRERSVKFKVEPIFSWDPTLLRHQAQCYFYLVHNNFIFEFQKLILKMPSFSYKKECLKLHRISVS